MKPNNLGVHVLLLHVKDDMGEMFILLTPGKEFYKTSFVTSLLYVRRFVDFVYVGEKSSKDFSE